MYISCHQSAQTMEKRIPISRKIYGPDYTSLHKDPNHIQPEEKDSENLYAYLGPSVIVYDHTEIPWWATKIGQNAFKNIQALEGVYYLKNIKVIDTSAFEGCKNLKEISLPDTIKSIRKNAFKSCGLETVSFFRNYLVDKPFPGNGTVIRDNAFEYCRQLKTVQFPEYLHYVGNRAFADTALEKIKIPKNCVFGYNVFSGCSIRELEVPISGFYFYDENTKLRKFEFYPIFHNVRGSIERIIFYGDVRDKEETINFITACCKLKTVNEYLFEPKLERDFPHFKSLIESCVTNGQRNGTSVTIGFSSTPTKKMYLEELIDTIDEKEGDANSINKEVMRFMTYIDVREGARPVRSPPAKKTKPDE